jgi:hypothetical protein
MYTITANIHIDQVLYFGEFCGGGILSRQQFYLPFMWSFALSQVNIHQGQVLYFSGFFVVGGFCPNKNPIFSYVYHYIKDSYISSFVFWGILAWGGFCPDNNFTFFPCGLIQLTLNTKQIMFWEHFVPRKILSRVGFSPLLYHSITVIIH